jgi:hypothetical protein
MSAGGERLVDGSSTSMVGVEGVEGVEGRGIPVYYVSANSAGEARFA